MENGATKNNQTDGLPGRLQAHRGWPSGKFKGSLGRRLLLVLALSLLELSSINAAAQVRVSALMKGGTPLRGTDQVRCIRYSDFNDVDVSLDMTLDAGDELYSPNGGITMEIRGSADSKFKTLGRFRFIVMPLNGRDIAINLLTGEGHMQASAPSGLSSGETNMGSGHTEYAARVYRTEQGPVQELIVYEGDVGTYSRDLKTNLVTGQKLLLLPKTKPTVATVTEKDIYQAASVYAQVDTGKAVMAGKAVNAEQAYATLLTRYSSVFSEPTNAKSRFSLAVEQVNLTVTSDAIYQLNKAEQFTSATDTGSRAVIAVTKGAAFTQAGRSDAAAAEFKKAKTLNPAVFQEENLRSYGLNESIRNQIRGSGFKTLEKPEPEPKQSISDQNMLFDLLKNGRYEEAVEGFQRRMRTPEANSRDYYGAAEAYFSLKKNQEADRESKIALALFQEDKRLSTDEYTRTEYILKETQSIDTQPSWPVPPKLWRRQAELFKLILEKRFGEAQALRERPRSVKEKEHRVQDSIDYYEAAIIFYETKRMVSANRFAALAIRRSGEDHLLSEDAYAACKRIFEATRQQ